VERRGPSRSLESLPAPLRGIGGLLLLIAAAGAIAFAALSVSGALDSDEVRPDRIFDAAVAGDAEGDPFVWESSRRRDFERRAALGYSHVLYALSPGGALASAKRTARFREQIDAAADEHGVSADLIEAMVLLESAGRPEVIAGGSDPANASGLAQIVASTGISLLEMPIDLPRSQELTTRIITSLRRAETLRGRAAEAGAKPKKEQQRKAAKLLFRAEEAENDAEVARRERVRVDPRFDPEAALDAMGRYLAIARDSFAAEDLAVTSYHMGIGNLGDVVEAYVGPEQAEMNLADLIEERDLSYAQLFFDSSPTRNPQTWKLLDGFGDDSKTYYWRVLAALEIMELYRDDRAELKRLIDLHGNKATAEEVFHPEDDTRTFDDPGEIRDGLDSGELVLIPAEGDLGFRVGPQLGALADSLGEERKLYRSLRPEALATLIYMSGRVQAITGKSGSRQELIVTSAVRDRAYQERLVGRNAEATPNYSLHTTGYSFDILREYANDRQAAAFQFALDRLKALGVIDYAREPRAIHVTVSGGAEPLLE
jgi:hypothetical protein